MAHIFPSNLLPLNRETHGGGQGVWRDTSAPRAKTRFESCRQFWPFFDFFLKQMQGKMQIVTPGMGRGLMTDWFSKVTGQKKWKWPFPPSLSNFMVAGSGFGIFVLSRLDHDPSQTPFRECRRSPQIRRCRLAGVLSDLSLWELGSPPESR